MLKIAMVTSCYHPVINGVVRMIELYREHLTALGHQVTVFTFGRPTSQDGDHTIRIPAVPLGSTGYYFRPRFPKSILEQLNQMDIIHCHHLFMGPELLAGRVKPPIVYTNHTRYDLYTEVYMPVPIPSLRKGLAQRAIKRLWPRNTAGCTAVIAPSQNVAEVMRAFGVAAPVHVIHNGIKLEKFTIENPTRHHKPEGSYVTGVYVGRLANEKNIQPLLEAMIKICQQNKKIRFRLVGSGPQQAASLRLIAKHKMGKQIILEGWMDKKEVRRVLAKADFQVSMSISEVHPLAIIEGMAAGLPAIVLADPAMSECVGDGALVAEDRLEWIKAVEELSQSAELRKSLGAKAAQQARKYAIKQTVNQTIQLYQSLT